MRSDGVMSETIDVGEWFSETMQKMWKRIRDHFEGYEINRKEILHKLSLIFIFISAFLIRLFPYFLGYSPLIKAFDPYFQLRSAEYINEHGIIAYLKWIDLASWYPYGRFVGKTMYIAVPISAVLVYKISTFLGISITLQEAAFIVPAIFGTLGVIYSYYLGKELISKRAGLFVALFMATTPSYMSRSIAGFFDNEALGVLFSLMTLYYFVRAFNRDSDVSAFFAGISLFLLASSWGAFRFTYDLLPLYLLLLIATGKMTYRHLKAYTITIGIGTLGMMMLPRIGGKIIFSPEGALPFAVLGIAIVYLLFTQLAKELTPAEFKRMLAFVIILVLALGAILAIILTWLGVIGKIGDKFVSVVIPTDRNNFPLIDSVSEHLPMSWGNLFFNIDSMALFIPVGIYYTIKKPTEKNLFTLTYVLATIYFSGSMVRLVLLLAPAASLATGLAIDNILIPYALATFDKIDLTKTTMRLETIGKEHALGAYFIISVLVLFNIFGGVNVAKSSLSGAEIAPGRSPYNYYTDWQEAVLWLRENANYKTALANGEHPPVVLSWWDYGYWITAYGQAATLADGSTINSSQIGTVGTMLMWNISYSLRLMYLYNVKYVLINSAGVNPDAGSDLGKAIWMIRISEKYTPEYGVKEGDYFDKKKGQYIDKFYDSLLYNLMVFKSDDMTAPNAPFTVNPGGQDVAAASYIPDYKDHPADPLVKAYFREVFRSKGFVDQNNPQPGQYPWVRIYEVIYPINIDALAYELIHTMTQIRLNSTATDTNA